MDSFSSVVSFGLSVAPCEFGLWIGLALVITLRVELVTIVGCRFAFAGKTFIFSAVHYIDEYLNYFEGGKKSGFWFDVVKIKAKTMLFHEP